MRNRHGLLPRATTAVALGAAAVLGSTLLATPAQALPFTASDGACPYVVTANVANVRTSPNSTANNVSHHLYAGDEVVATESTFADEGSGNVVFRRLATDEYIAVTNLGPVEGACAYPPN
ncbi:hypothetical protein IDM40_10800 [Nocardiopsis sp. HNM0947]|uniref:Secreted protein n=1 Tax=Nocardiopsis coralli TaxID=2772213 RepID=A0ABR9P5R1_9ACTN|nr:hypothetical protein [Nocardiopsis coralli]MBE2999188.1 hypothetical protein [Nocardiopsis coralli]